MWLEIPLLDLFPSSGSTAEIVIYIFNLYNGGGGSGFGSGDAHDAPPAA